MKVFDEEGVAMLRASAIEVAEERFPTVDDLTTIQERIDRQIKEARDQWADEIVDWTVQTEVDLYGDLTEDDLTLAVHSQGDTLYTVTLWDIFASELNILDDADGDDRDDNGRSSREWQKQRLAKALRALADRVEKHRPARAALEAKP